MKTPNVSEFTEFRPFKKREARERENARARELDFSLDVALSLSRSRASHFLKLVNFRHV